MDIVVPTKGMEMPMSNDGTRSLKYAWEIFIKDGCVWCVLELGGIKHETIVHDLV